MGFGKGVDLGKHIFREGHVDPNGLLGSRLDRHENGNAVTIRSIRHNFFEAGGFGNGLAVLDQPFDMKGQGFLGHAPGVVQIGPGALRGLLLTYSEKALVLEKRVQELLPSQEALQRIAEADGSLCITDAAKALQMRPKDLFEWLRQNGWIYRRPGSGHDLGYQSKTATGLLEHKVTTVLRADGSEKVTEQVRVTPKGLTKLAALIKPAISRAA